MNFDKYVQLYNHYYYWDVEYFHNPEKFLHAPFPIFLQALGTTDLIFVPIVLLFLECHIHTIPQDVAFFNLISSMKHNAFKVYSCYCMYQ